MSFCHQNSAALCCGQNREEEKTNRGTGMHIRYILIYAKNLFLSFFLHYEVVKVPK